MEAIVQRLVKQRMDIISVIKQLDRRYVIRTGLVPIAKRIAKNKIRRMVIIIVTKRQEKESVVQAGMDQTVLSIAWNIMQPVVTLAIEKQA